MNKVYQKPIQKRIEEVKAAVLAHQKEVDREVKKYARQYEVKASRLKADALREEDMIDRAVLQGAVEFSVGQAELAINLAFEDIQKAVEEWIASPPSSDFTVVMATVDRFGLQLSRSEIEILSTLASGSYIGQKVLNTFATANAMTTNFQPVERIMQLISAARSDAMTAVRAYCTQNMNTYDWITDKKYSIWKRAYAENYLNMERSSMTDLMEILNAVMNPNVSLIPSEVERIEKYFDGYEGEDRISRMRELIMTDPDHADRFSLYDPAVYKAARQQIREEKIMEAQAAQEALREASRKAIDARNEAVRAKLAE